MKTGKQEIAIEIYRQKYEIFRHLDRLRWQLPTIALPAGGAVLGLASNGEGWPNWWALLLFGFMSGLVGFAIRKIRLGIHKNHVFLTDIAAEIGDFSIPEPKKRFGATWWFAWFMVFLGIISVGLSIWRGIVSLNAC